MLPGHTARPYLNFADKRVAIGDAIGAEAFARLEHVKATIDPNGRFRSGHAFESSNETRTELTVADLDQLFPPTQTRACVA